MIRQKSRISGWRLLALLTAIALTLLPAARPMSAAGSPGSAAATASTFIGLLAKGDFAAAEQYFNATLQAELPAPALAKTWASITGQLGAFEREGSAKSMRSGGITTVVVSCAFASATADLAISFDPTGKIEGLH